MFYFANHIFVKLEKTFIKDKYFNDKIESERNDKFLLSETKGIKKKKKTSNLANFRN